MQRTLKNLVKNTTAEFVCYRDGDLWYRINMPESNATPISEIESLPLSKQSTSLFEFPVPIADTGTGIFPAKTKAISLMRWIRKQLDKIDKGEWK